VTLPFVILATNLDTGELRNKNNEDGYVYLREELSHITPKSSLPPRPEAAPSVAPATPELLAGKTMALFVADSTIDTKFSETMKSALAQNLGVSIKPVPDGAEPMFVMIGVSGPQISRIKEVSSFLAAFKAEKRDVYAIVVRFAREETPFINAEGQYGISSEIPTYRFLMNPSSGEILPDDVAPSNERSWKDLKNLFV
jgi:hypothetical protein